jgi:hypothetical protein
MSSDRLPVEGASHVPEGFDGKPADGKDGLRKKSQIFTNLAATATRQHEGDSYGWEKPPARCYEQQETADLL